MNILELVTMNNPYKSPAIEINHPLGVFYLTKISAKILLEVSFVDRLTDIESSLDFKGVQRKDNSNRVKQISDYIHSIECAFPNTIILAVNIDEKTSSPIADVDEDAPEQDQAKEEHGHSKTIQRWEVAQDKDNANFIEISIPKAIKTASVIDGQHRLFGFKGAEDSLLEMELPCAVFFDLPDTLQAFLFATINYNQKPVPKSLAYVLYGLSEYSKDPLKWPPDKLAVNISRMLNKDKTSPFYKKIYSTAQDDKILAKYRKEGEWAVSTATIVEGVMRLITNNHKNDRARMFNIKTAGKEPLGRDKLKPLSKNIPLRDVYMNGSDDQIYRIIHNFFSIVLDITGKSSTSSDTLRKTIGIQALFDTLRIGLVCNVFTMSKLLDRKTMRLLLAPVGDINFSKEDLFPKASGIGRSNIRKAIGIVLEFDKKAIRLNEIKDKNIIAYLVTIR
jgi:DNA phosphorothioation-associated DGQHR protein 1